MNNWMIRMDFSAYDLMAFSQVFEILQSFYFKIEIFLLADRNEMNSKTLTFSRINYPFVIHDNQYFIEYGKLSNYVNSSIINGGKEQYFPIKDNWYRKSFIHEPSQSGISIHSLH